LLWSGRVHGPHPFIIAERPSQLKPNAAMFHDASRECPPRDPPTWSPTVTGVGGVSDATENICTSGVRCLPSEGITFTPKRLKQPPEAVATKPRAYRGGLGLQEKACGVSDILLGRPERAPRESPTPLLFRLRPHCPSVFEFEPIRRPAAP
jgi:hypothetical protein